MSTFIEPKFESGKSLSHYLSWYSENCDETQSKLWFDAYLLKNQIRIPSRAYNVGNIGFLCRAVEKGYVPHDATIQSHIDKRYAEWVEYETMMNERKVDQLQHKVPVVKVKPKFSESFIEDNTAFNIALERNFWGEDKKITQFERYRFSPRLTVPEIKLIQSTIESQIKELENVTNLEDEYKKAYPSASHIKKILSWLNSIIETRKAVLQSDSARTKRDIPPVKQVETMKYLKEIEGTDIKCLHPSKVIGANAVLMYNQKYRRIMFYDAADKFYAKGMAYLDVAAFNCKTLRKPESQLKELLALTKPQARAFIKSIAGSNGIVANRMTEHVGILKVWSSD